HLYSAAFSGSHHSQMIVKVLVTVCLILIPVLSSFVATGIDGIVPLIQQHYNINDSETATIRTTSSITHTFTLALVWFFGDSFKRRRLFLLSVGTWITLSILSIVLGVNSFMLFVVFRALGAAASSVFSVLVPVILADLYHDRALGVALMCLSVSEMAANLLTGIISSWIVTSTIPWQSGLLISTLLAMPPLLFLICARYHLRNVERPESVKGFRSIVDSAFGIFSIKSYLLMTVASSLLMLHGTAYGFWFPSVYLIAWTNVPEIFFGMSYTTITIVNSIVLMTGTGIGLPLILWFAQLAPRHRSILGQERQRPGVPDRYWCRSHS
ncbi:hypothetical protein PRIPAC_85270, partial [Pristionchus pacificus]